MSTELHEFPPEEVMAYLDGEITGERALALADHLQQCAECSALAGDFCALSQQLVAWKLEPSPLKQPAVPVPAEADAWCSEAAGDPTLNAEDPRFPIKEAPTAHRTAWPSSVRVLSWRRVGFAFAALLVVSLLSFRMGRFVPQSTPTSTYETEFQRKAARMAKVVDGADANDNSVKGTRTDVSVTTEPEEVPASRQEQTANERRRSLNLPVTGRNYINFKMLNSQTSREAVQMIEKTASLSMTVKETDAARTALEDIAKRHYGYFAELNTEGQSDAGRTLTASLRVPACELDATLGELRKIGHLDEEKQGGEEVSQQHIDLEARLKNSRKTEKRLTDLLTKRTDKLRDVLDVERELASTREEIERMEAQLRNMENQVSYASIDLKLREEYKPVLNLAPPAIGTRLRNALVNGYHSAVESALGLVLFLFQEGPTLLFWLLLLFFPARWTWRRLRALVAQKQSLAGAL